MSFDDSLLSNKSESSKKSYNDSDLFINKREFLASTDMNFRPINSATGPDGCLYIVDMYHGIIQESAWTKPDSYINPQIKRKNLDLNINRGRIYRLVHDGYKPGPAPHLLSASNEALIQYLSHPNGWWRDNAQKLLVIHADKSVVPALKKMVADQPSFLNKIFFWKKTTSPLARLHALWTLEGLNAIDQNMVMEKEWYLSGARVDDKKPAEPNNIKDYLRNYEIPPLKPATNDVDIYRIAFRSSIPEQDRFVTAYGIAGIPKTTAKSLPVVSWEHQTSFSKNV
jgi:hypothetical protein